jgi:membrane-bound PQQ-dependent dehydrogenase (glucose/quinate/shikimate family)
MSGDLRPSNQQNQDTHLFGSKQRCDGETTTMTTVPMSTGRTKGVHRFYALPGVLSLVSFLSLLFLSSLWSRSPADPVEHEWRHYGHDPGGMRYSPLSQITRASVASLAVAWTYRTGEVALGNPDRAFECTPLVVDGVMYVSTPSSRVIALDAETGRERWVFDPQSGRATREFLQHRGVAYWQSADGSDRRILYGTLEGRLIAVDARSGKPCPDFGRGGVDLRQGAADRWPDLQYAVTSPPAIYKDLVIMGALVPENPGKGPSGMVRAFDVRTGKLVWSFRTIPATGEPGSETWPAGAAEDRTGANVWSIISVDVDNGLVFLPIGSASYDFYGGDREGMNLYANSLVALEAATGKRRWHFQAVHHDLWDYDLAAQPILATVQRDGRAVPAVVQLTKTGLVFVLNRLTGEPLFPVEERPVPASDVPGEKAWPTQPFPLKPAPLSRLSLSEKDISDVTPESERYCRALFNQTKGRSIYTPVGLELTLYVPGTLGGGNWSGGSVDPGTGILYVNTNEVGALGYMKRQPDGSPSPYRRTSEWGEYARFWDPNRWSCTKPPWGLLHAIDLNSGENVWKVPLGKVDELEAKGVKQTGALSLGGAIVTAGGLVFIAGTNDSRFRAFDSSDGSLLWETRLEASGHATPVTFRGRAGGKQYVAVAAGGGGYFSKTLSDVVVAYALP